MDGHHDGIHQTCTPWWAEQGRRLTAQQHIDVRESERRGPTHRTTGRGG
jgi:hypothetical protein